MSDKISTTTRIFRMINLFFTGLFLLGVIFQVYLAGMVVVAGQMNWENHKGLGHSLAGPLLFMLAAAYLGRVPGRTKLLTWMLVVVYVLQADVVIFLRGSAPLVSALHPVLALIDFALAVALVRDAWLLVREDSATQRLASRIEPSTSD